MHTVPYYRYGRPPSVNPGQRISTETGRAQRGCCTVDSMVQFLTFSGGADATCDTWVGMWSLGMDDGKGAKGAMRWAHELVLKPQRERGGNNIYRETSRYSSHRCHSRERVVCRDRIYSPCRAASGVYLVRPGTARVCACSGQELQIINLLVKSVWILGKEKWGDAGVCVFVDCICRLTTPVL